MEEIVSFESHGAMLRGILGRPETPRGIAAILIHGWSGYRIGPQRLLVHAGRLLNHRGVATLRFDLRGRGESDGEIDAACLDGMIDDARAALEFLIGRTSPDRVAAIGICSGGNVAIGAATLDPRVDRLALWSTLPFIPQKRAADQMRRKAGYSVEYFRKLFRRETWRKLLRGAINFGMIRRVLFGKGDLKKNDEGRNPKDSSRDIMAAFAQYRGEALFAYGGNDPEAPGAREVYESFCRARGIPSEFVIVEGANHNFYSERWRQELLESTANWLLQDYRSDDGR